MRNTALRRTCVPPAYTAADFARMNPCLCELRECLWRAKSLAEYEFAHRVETCDAMQRGGIQEWSATQSRRFPVLVVSYRRWSAGRVRIDSHDEERLVS